jgi:hypothetical protein
MFERINISDELIRERLRSQSLDKARNILANSAKDDEEVLLRLRSEGKEPGPFNAAFESDKVFRIDQIEKICINYRLRFLDTKYFRHEFPYEAISKINEFERKYNTKVKRFKIIAPDVAFDLEDCNKDPLLFAQLDNERFYLLHKWGNDLAWYRKFLYYPVRSIYTYFYFMLAVAALFAFLVPFEWFQVREDNILYMRVWFTAHCFIGLFFICIFLGAIMQTGFSSMNWKSKFMNE